MRKDLQERIEACLNSTEGKFDPLASLTAETIENTELGPVLAAFAMGKPQDLIACAEEIHDLARGLSDCLDVYAAFWQGETALLAPEKVGKPRACTSNLVRAVFDLQAALAYAYQLRKEGGSHE